MRKSYTDFISRDAQLPSNDDPRFRVPTTPYNVCAAPSARLQESRPDGDLYTYNSLGIMCGSSGYLVVKDGLVIKEMAVCIA
jgi:hypothetical protein